MIDQDDDHDFIRAGLLAAADNAEADFPPPHHGPAMLDTSGRVSAAAAPATPLDLPPVAPDRGTVDRLHRAEAEVIEAWGVLHTTTGFRPAPGESLPAAIRRALSAANLKE